MQRWTVWALCSVLAVAELAAVLAADPATPAPASSPSASPQASLTPCPVTEPNGNTPPPEATVAGRGAGGYGNEALWTALWMWDEGEIPVPLSHVLPDGSLGELKWSWFRYVPGRLSIEGRRLDAPAPPLRAHIPEGYGDRGFQPVGLIFPTGGCWEITGRVGTGSLSFVTLVVPPPSAATPEATP